VADALEKIVDNPAIDRGEGIDPVDGADVAQRQRARSDIENPGTDGGKPWVLESPGWVCSPS
jgi:hypothetical protein